MRSSPTWRRRHDSVEGTQLVLARQHVWLGPEATSFAAPCEACLARREPDLWGISIAAARVEGELRLDADVGFTTCARGHRVVVRRIGVDTRKRRRAGRKAFAFSRAR